MRGAWIEIMGRVAGSTLAKSLPVRGAWIEIVTSYSKAAAASVAPRAGSVD